MNARNRVALPTALSLAAAAIILAFSAFGDDPDPATAADGSPEQPPPSNGAISPQMMADSLHLVIAADREMYCRFYIERQAGHEAPAEAHGRMREPLPLPFEIFQRAVESTQSKGAEFSYALRSLHPIGPRNGPQTELEQRGLDFIASHPDRNFYGRETLGGRRYVTADLPAVAACIECHNQRAPENAQPFRVGDAMGGIVVRVPLEF